MLFDEPMVIHSEQSDGRHWLTTIDIPPLQIWPVARNHCRAGHFLAKVVSAKLAALGPDIPAEVTLTRADVSAISSLAERYPKVQSEVQEVHVRLVEQAGPAGADDTEEQQDDEPSLFITPLPPVDWKGDYDSWIFTATRALGVDTPQPTDQRSYEQAMSDAAADLQKRLSALRGRFLNGMEGLNLGFKVGLTTRSGGKEYVWVRPTDWKDESILVCVLESQPNDCKGYKLGKTLKLPVTELVDYAIGSENAGVVEAGPTQQIAEDYGLVVP